MMMCGWHCKVGTMGALHSKVLRTTCGALAEVSTGRAFALLTSDAVRFDQMAVLYAPWFASLSVCATFGFMIYDLGIYAAIAGTGVLLTSMAVQFALGKGFENLRRKTASATDDRVHLTSEVLLSMHSVKTGAWESSLIQAIAKKRQREAGAIRRAQILRALSLGTYFASIPFSALAAFSVHVVIKTPKTSNLSIGTASSVIALLSVARNFAYLLSRYSMTIPEIKVACHRMADFLQLPEVEPPSACRSTTDDTLLALDDAVFKWPSAKKPVVGPVTFQVKRGELVCITGETGCGKTAILHGCLSELDLVQGNLQVLHSADINLSLDLIFYFLTWSASCVLEVVIIPRRDKILNSFGFSLIFLSFFVKFSVFLIFPPI